MLFIFIWEIIIFDNSQKNIQILIEFARSYFENWQQKTNKYRPFIKNLKEHKILFVSSVIKE